MRHGTHGGTFPWTSWSCIKIIGAAPICFLDDLFIGLAQALEWEIVFPANRRVTNAAAQKHGVFFAYLVGPFRKPKIDLEFHTMVPADPAWTITMTTEQARELLEWIATVADWELEDLVEEKVVTRRHRRRRGSGRRAA